MSRIFKNQTANDVVLNDISEVIPANGQLDLGGKTLQDLAQSDDLLTVLATGDLVLDLGDGVDLSPGRAVDIIRNVPQIYQTTVDGKLTVSASPKPGKTVFNLTSRMDSMAGLGMGDRLHIDHQVFQFGDTEDEFGDVGRFVDDGLGTDYSQYWMNTKYINFATIANRTYIYNGGIAWQGLNQTGLVTLTLEAVPKVLDLSPYVATSGTGNAFVSGGYLVVPHPTNQGTHTLPIGQNEAQTPQDLNFLEVKPSIQTGQWSDPVFWMIEYNLTTNEYRNLLPNPDPYNPVQDLNTGDSNIVKMVGNLFTLEVPLAAYIKELMLIGDSNGFFDLGIQDPTELGEGTRLRLCAKTIVNNKHNNIAWSLVAYIKTYREDTT
jgi:hypothetical protein